MEPTEKNTTDKRPPGTAGASRAGRAFLPLLLAAATVGSIVYLPSAHAAELGYGGRLTDASGAPEDGPMSMSVRFYTAPTGGDPVGPTLNFPEIALVDGIFQLTLTLNDLQMSQVFGAGDYAVYVEVAAQGKSYPRQKFLAVPYALRIPVDGDTLTYGTDGRLKVESISLSQVEGLATALAAKADANTVTSTLATKADATYVDTQLAAKADSTALGSKAAANASLSGDVSGTLSGTITVDKIKNTSLPTPNPSQDSGKYLQYNGTAYVLSTISGSSGGTVTSVTASSPLIVTNSATTPALTLSVASSVADGYLSSSDFTAFNNKQAAITTSSSINAGTLTTEQQNGLHIKPFGASPGNTGELRLSELAASGSEYVGLKAPDAIAASTIWTLPAADGADGQVLKTNGSGILSWTSSLSPTGAAGGDLGSTYPNPTVAQVGGVAAASIASGANAANAATAANNPSTIVARDGSGNFAAGTITAALNGNATTATTATNISGVVAVANGGTNATTIAEARTNLGAAAAGANGDITSLSGLTTPLSASQGGTGAATAMPLTVFAGPNAGSSAGGPSFRSLVAEDLPDLSANKITSGILPVSQGGTGLGTSPTSGQILIGNGSGYDLGSIVAGNNITVGNGSGTITISATTDANKVSTSGDTMTGLLTLPSDGLVAGGSQLVLAGGNVGIGTTAPTAPLEVVSTSSAVGRGLAFAQVSDNNLGSQVFFRKARNTPAAPSAVQSGDTLGRLAWAGYTGTQFKGGASVAGFAAENWTDSASGSYLLFQTTATGSTSSVERMRIDPAGNVGIGSSAPSATLDVNGTVRAQSFVSTSGASDFSAQGIHNVSSLAIGTTTAGTDLSFGSGANRAIAVQPSATSGNNLTVQAGGTSASSGDVNGGNLVLSSGAATGAGTSSIEFKTASGGAPATSMIVTGSGKVGIGTIYPMSSTLHVVRDSASTGHPWDGNAINVENPNQTNGTFSGLLMTTRNSTNTSITTGSVHSVINDHTAGSVSADLVFGNTSNQVYSEKMRIKSGGNVGIGTTSPFARLDVSGEARVGAAPATLTTVSGAHTNAVTTITVVSTTGYPSSGTLLIGGEAISYTGTSTTTFIGCTRGVLGTTAAALVGGETVDVYLSTSRTSATTPRTVITASGKVGIATTSPATNIQIAGQVSTISGLENAVAYFAAASSNVNDAGIVLGSTNGNAPYIAASKTGEGTAAPLRFLSNNTERVTIAGDGNVGIGATSPGARVHVVDAQNNGWMYTQYNDADGTNFRNQRARGTVAEPSAVLSGDRLASFLAAGYNGSSFNYQNGGLNIYAAEDYTSTSTGGTYLTLSTSDTGTNPAGGGTERLRITASGNIGIGTTAPTTKLEVAGIIKSTSGGFVFPDGSTQTTAALKSVGSGGGAASTPSSGCPTGYILVPGDTNYSTTDFCVMKYEAKYGLKGAESRMAGLPARGNVSQIDAKASCRNLGPGYALINNAEWMTLATNVANRASNWSGNAVGSGALNRGHSDNAPSNALAASTDTDACSGTGQTCSDTTWNDQRRTHTLSNGNVIWDLAGNVWEWVDYNNYEDKPTPATAAWTEYTGVTGTTTMAKTELVPTIAQTGSWNGATNGIGQYYAGTNSSGGALLRGGFWHYAAVAGVFAASLSDGPSVTSTRPRLPLCLPARQPLGYWSLGHWSLALAPQILDSAPFGMDHGRKELDKG